MIDKAYLDSLTELLGKSTVDQIRLEYVQDSTNKLNQLMSAWGNRDFEELQQLSHSLKSASLNMAAKQFAQQCEIIEKSAKKEDETPIQTVIESLSDLHRETLMALSGYFSMLK
ncbi:Hpt domain-containing protein [Marinomonas posidonica]|uniref:Hpt domain protein n=1 Tax=Marinomonas posidonica (strain CECT 7376 / NCIMB 14433 / IVIA-Po-181) TaxID=491952 RepID=F6CVN4_MARPP|nr:Hpt domain-containing protein [Marinomonas posidonica]AEF56508.1 Hpt domain protein [Marinomonas posidonica IVIA-Po-181]